MSEEPALVVTVLALPKVAASCGSGLWQELCLRLVATTVDWLCFLFGSFVEAYNAVVALLVILTAV